MSEWQPIETAPKDRRGYVLLCDKKIEIGGNLFIGWWDGRKWRIDFSPRWQHAITPTHWMPLPEPPK